MRTAEEILNLYVARRKHYDPLHTSMREIMAIYDGTVTIPLPDAMREESPSVPNLLAQGVDQMAGRIASVTPMVAFSAENPSNRNSLRQATTARRVLQGWWQADELMLKMKRRARYLIAYAIAPAVVRYNFKTGRPTWQVRNPMMTFPNEQTVDESNPPVDVIFAYRRSVGWLRAQGYEDAIVQVFGSNAEMGDDELVLMLEHVDEEASQLVLTGTMDTSTSSAYLPQRYMTTPGDSKAVKLEVCVTGGIMCASVPARIALNGPSGQFTSMVPMFFTQAKLMALEVAAVQKGIFPDTYLEGRPGESPTIVDGPHDGRTGKITIVEGGKIHSDSYSPGYMTQSTIDRLERNQRITSGTPSEFGGESPSNVRTARRGDAVMGGVIDFPLSEAQDVFAHSLANEDKAAIALAKMYDGSAPKSIYVGIGNDAQKVTYQARKVFTHDEHVVAYPISGTDINTLNMQTATLVGAGVMSVQTSAEMNPLIANAEVEHDRIIAEGLERALMGGIQEQAASGQLPPMIVSKVAELVKSDKMELAEALTKVVEDAAQAQAQATATPGAPPTADQMAAPGAAALTGSPIPGATAGQESLADMMGTLRQPQMTIMPGRGVPQGAM